MKGRDRVKVFCGAHPTVRPLGTWRVGCWLSISLQCQLISQNSEVGSITWICSALWEPLGARLFLTKQPWPNKGQPLLSHLCLPGHLRSNHYSTSNCYSSIDSNFISRDWRRGRCMVLCSADTVQLLDQTENSEDASKDEQCQIQT